jgi:hypothetical protein
MQQIHVNSSLPSAEIVAAPPAAPGQLNASSSEMTVAYSKSSARRYFSNSALRWGLSRSMSFSSCLNLPIRTSGPRCAAPRTLNGIGRRPSDARVIVNFSLQSTFSSMLRSIGSLISFAMMPMASQVGETQGRARDAGDAIRPAGEALQRLVTSGCLQTHKIQAASPAADGMAVRNSPIALTSRRAVRPSYWPARGRSSRAGNQASKTPSSRLRVTRHTE